MGGWEGLIKLFSLLLGMLETSHNELKLNIENIKSTELKGKNRETHLDSKRF